MEEAEKLAIDSREALRKIRNHWLSHVVHEMRGPLFAARGYAKLLLDERGGDVTVTQRKYLLTILENINKLSVSVNGLREFTSQEELNLEFLDLSDLLQLALADWRAREKTLLLTEHISTGPALTAGDRAKLSSAVHKLLGAMVEFSRSGGKIDLYARREEDEFLVRVTAAANAKEPAAVVPDIAMPCEILRLHGGLASVDCSHPGFCNLNVRLPLILPEPSGRENVAALKGK